MTHRVVITGAAGISPLGNDWPSIREKLLSGTNAVRYMSEWSGIEGLNSRVFAPAVEFDLPKALYNRKTTRSMSRVALMATRAAELALRDAEVFDQDWIHDGSVGVSCGSCSGSPEAMIEIASMNVNHCTRELNATSYVRFMSHTAPVNIGIFHRIKGRQITTSSACTSGSQGIGYAYEAIKFGMQRAMLAGGAEEANVAQTAIFDTLFATSTGNNQTPQLTPRPFDVSRDGLVLGEGAGILFLESLESAQARGAKIYAEIVGFATNCDGTHITNPNSEQMAQVMRMALENAGLKPEDIGYINAHGTATIQGDAAESQAIEAVFGQSVPVSTLKSYMGHTLGACGALEAWISLEMMNEDWFAPTLNLKTPDPQCGTIAHIMDKPLTKHCEYIMSNNFAFGGINTSLIFKRVAP